MDDSFFGIENRFYSKQYDKINPETRKHLIGYFKPHNKKLYESLGKKFDWDK